MHFVDMLLYCARATPEKQAIILPDRMISFAMLGAGIRSAGAAIAEAGLNSRHVVAVRINSQSRHLIVVSALYRLGIVSVSVTGDEELAKAGVKVDAVIGDENRPILGIGRLVLLKDDWFTRYSDAAARPAAFDDEGALARIILSSGTTAAPKAIGMSARVVEDRILTGRRTLTLAPWDRMMCLPVLTSSLGFGSALQALAYGHSVVFADSPVEALQMIAAYQVDLVVANPRQLQAMVEAHRENPIPIPSLRLIKFGGDSISPHLVSEIRARLCNNVLCVYSSTESGPVAFAPIDRILDRPGATGFVAPWVEADILGPDERPVPRGSEGRLRVRTEWQGYDVIEGPDAANRPMYPGDIASISVDGMLSLVGRAADAIDVGGAFVAPEQIERALSGFPGVGDVAAVGVPRGGRNEIWIGVTARGAVDEQAIKNFLLGKNARWAIARVKTLEQISRNDMGKIVRARVREMLLAS
ncbi:MAG TPA: fatty acid--CoA ligase family protein [Pseudolabrys sp.]|nr:fatty acid--CoA ligase family protein [Pseudolabrys sp.]